MFFLFSFGTGKYFLVLFDFMVFVCIYIYLKNNQPWNGEHSSRTGPYCLRLTCKVMLSPLFSYLKMSRGQVIAYSGQVLSKWSSAILLKILVKNRNVWAQFECQGTTVVYFNRVDKNIMESYGVIFFIIFKCPSKCCCVIDYWTK